MGKDEGFLDGLLKDMERNAAFTAAINASRGPDGKPDPYKAAGIAAGRGYTSLSDTAQLGAMLGAAGAFDDDD